MTLRFDDVIIIVITSSLRIYKQIPFRLLIGVDEIPGNFFLISKLI